MVECIEGAGADGHELLPHERELDHLYGPGGAARRVSRKHRDAVYLRARQHRCVKGRGLLCLLGIPKMRDDFRQSNLLAISPGVGDSTVCSAPLRAAETRACTITVDRDAAAASDAAKSPMQMRPATSRARQRRHRKHFQYS